MLQEYNCLLCTVAVLEASCPLLLLMLLLLHTAVPTWQGSHKKGKPSEPSPGSTVVLDPLPHPDQVLHSVSFSPNYRGCLNLAYGGGAGVVRVHTVSAEVVPTGM
jgi:hypothetical protein